MKILFWVPYPTEGASNRYRIQQYFPYLEKHGIEYTFRPFWSSRAFKMLYRNKGAHLQKIFFFLKGTFTRIIDLFLVHRYDIVVIHRQAYPIGGAFFERILSRMNKPIIFDFDDAIFLSDTCKSNFFAEAFKNPQKTSQIIALSSAVIAGNSYLAAFASQYNRNVSIIPTPVDENTYVPVQKPHQETVVIGWMGSVTTSLFLTAIRTVLIKLVNTYPHVRCTIVGGEFEVPGVASITSKPWSLEGELSLLQSFDIGIMPMPDNDWTKGKCGFKALLYMSVAIPCVCSPVGFNNVIITEGQNGLFARDEKEWFDKLALLIENKELRQRLGSAGRKTLIEKYSLSANADKFIAVLQNVYTTHCRKT